MQVLKHLIHLCIFLVVFGILTVWPLGAQTNTDPSTYGTSLAISPIIGGGGLFGAGVKYQLNEDLFLDGALLYRPGIVIDYADNIEVFSGLAVTGGLSYIMGSRFVEHKQKIKRNGIYLRAGHTFSRINDNFLSIGWLTEGFRIGNEQRSFQFELGPMLLHNSWINKPENWPYDNDVNEISFGIFWKVAWNFYTVK